MSSQGLYPSAAKLGHARPLLANVSNDGSGHLTPAAGTAMYVVWDAGAAVKGLPAFAEFLPVDSAQSGTLNAGKIVLYYSTQRAGGTTPANTWMKREVPTPQLNAVVNAPGAGLGPIVVTLDPIEADQVILASVSVPAVGTACWQVSVFGTLLT